MTPPQIPSLSREVHFILPNGRHRTAKVISDQPEDPQQPTLKVDLDPFTDTLSIQDTLDLGENAKVIGRHLFVRNVPYDETGQTVRTYHWPERV